MKWILGTAVMLLVAPGSGASQERVDVVVVSSAVEAVLEERDLDGVVVEGGSNHALGVAVAERVGLDFRGKATRCRPGARPRCTIDGATTVVSFDSPAIDGGRAEVLIGLTFAQPEPPGELADQIWSVRLEETDGGWEVTETEWIFST